MPTVHFVDEEHFPRTLCGVDVQEKSAVLWSDEFDDEITCKNCRKLKEGGHMGAPPPKYTPPEPLDPILEEKIKIWARLERLESFREKLKSLLITVNVNVVGGVIDETELSECVATQEHIDCAVDRLGNAIAILQYNARHMEDEGGQQ